MTGADVRVASPLTLETPTCGRQSVVEQFLRINVGMDAAEAAREAALLGPAVSSNLESRLRDVMWPSTRPCRPAADL